MSKKNDYDCVTVWSFFILRRTTLFIPRANGWIVLLSIEYSLFTFDVYFRLNVTRSVNEFLKKNV